MDAISKLLKFQGKLWRYASAVNRGKRTPKPANSQAIDLVWGQKCHKKGGGTVATAAKKYLQGIDESTNTTKPTR
ncbi:hypothetical protein [Giesbergeria sp.]|uniref:hypothetical protein n=1 Tax=Giesbergeria sp. TaxID=2818473 RepID=UPI002629547E|nr:hypothetical protein [Giesbergeria sp.]